MTQSAVVALVTLISLLLYLLGFKHNQVPFFLQTLGLLSYTVDNREFSVVRFLYAMRTAYYQYGEPLGLVP